MVHFQSSRLSEMSLFVPHGNDIFTQSLYSQAFSIRILKMQLNCLLSSTVFDEKYEVSVILFFFFPLCTICFLNFILQSAFSLGRSRTIALSLVFWNLTTMSPLSIWHLSFFLLWSSGYFWSEDSYISLTLENFLLLSFEVFYSTYPLYPLVLLDVGTYESIFRVPNFSFILFISCQGIP